MADWAAAPTAPREDSTVIPGRVIAADASATTGNEATR